MVITQLPCKVVTLLMFRVRVRFSGTKKRIAFKLGVLAAQITGSCTKNVVVIKRLPCKVVKLQVSRVRVRFSGTKYRIAFKLGMQVDQYTGNYQYKFVGATTLPFNHILILHLTILHQLH